MEPFTGISKKDKGGQHVTLHTAQTILITKLGIWVEQPDWQMPLGARLDLLSMDINR